MQHVRLYVWGALCEVNALLHKCSKKGCMCCVYHARIEDWHLIFERRFMWVCILFNSFAWDIDTQNLVMQRAPCAVVSNVRTCAGKGSRSCIGIKNCHLSSVLLLKMGHIHWTVFAKWKPWGCYRHGMMVQAYRKSIKYNISGHSKKCDAGTANMESSISPKHRRFQHQTDGENRTVLQHIGCIGKLPNFTNTVYTVSIQGFNIGQQHNGKGELWIYWDSVHASLTGVQITDLIFRNTWCYGILIFPHSRRFCCFQRSKWVTKHWEKAVLYVWGMTLYCLYLGAPRICPREPSFTVALAITLVQLHSSAISESSV